MDDGAEYNGKQFDLDAKIRHVLTQVAGTPSFQELITLPRPKSSVARDSIPLCQTLDQFLTRARDVPPVFERQPFHAPCLISFSSGTTGEPKCIVHSVGGLILNSLNEGVLHGELNHNSTLLQYTTTGWVSSPLSCLDLYQDFY